MRKRREALAVCCALGAAVCYSGPSRGASSPRTAIAYNAISACINGTVYSNNVLPRSEGEFTTNGLDREFWGRYRGDGSQRAPLGNWVSNFQTTWGRHQYNTYFGDKNDGVSTPADDPFVITRDPIAPGNPQALQITAKMMPSHLIGNTQVGGEPYYSGALMTPINLQYGLFVVRVRTPAPGSGLSPAFWILQGQDVQAGPHGNLSGEWDIQEMFAATKGNGTNQGEILWNSGVSAPQNWGGSYDWPSWETTLPSQDYHDYGVLLAPGGAPISADDNGSGGPGNVNGPTYAGATFFLDGQPVPGHSGGADLNLTANVNAKGYWKEIMAMFQVSSSGWLGAASSGDLPSSYWIQWIRVYQPTAASC